ncbi:glycosyltransferase [Sporolactobacillus pectinivorans]|uniref:glycosyltransferase n=1 Tax=Sporolactobacillus pectinivorans TaxID=1591408 RepID=UPI000C257B24|nr:glycosyltransferase family 2 protein [Sporolactobacillus pectinivorans]
MDISVIIPTFNEGDNVHLIAERLKKVLLPLNRPFEILFMDDSIDDTPDRLNELAKRNPFVHYIHRTSERGLAKAVVEGLHHANGKILVVMDADLQHPPESIPEMVKKIEEGYQMVIPSRFVKGGSDGGLNSYRKFVSWTARIIARLTLKRLRKITDPTSGFFAVRKEAIVGKEFQPIGWKILLEIIVRANIDRIAEIPYQFHARDLGSSKMSAVEQLRYLIHLAKLVLASEEDRRFYLFSAVGLSGVVVNLAFYKLFLMSNLSVIVAFLLSSGISIFTNFLLNNSFTWKMEGSGGWFSWGTRLLKYVIVASGGLCVSGAIVSFFHYFINLPAMISGIIGIVAGIVWNFFLNDKWTFSTSKKYMLPEVKSLTERDTVIHDVEK